MGKIFPTKLTPFLDPYSSFLHLHRAKTLPYLEAGLHHISISYAKSQPENIPRKMWRILPRILFITSYYSRPTREGNGKSGNSDSCRNSSPSLYMLNLSLIWRRLSSPNPKIFPEKGLEFYHTFCSSHPTIRGLQEEETGNREIRMNAGTFLPCSI